MYTLKTLQITITHLTSRCAGFFKKTFNVFKIFVLNHYVAAQLRAHAARALRAQPRPAPARGLGGRLHFVGTVRPPAARRPRLRTHLFMFQKMCWFRSIFLVHFRIAANACVYTKDVCFKRFFVFVMVSYQHMCLFQKMFWFLHTSIQSFATHSNYHMQVVLFLSHPSPYTCQSRCCYLAFRLLALR